jgi:bifunctional UDP-N-acetylglucosamine pyrophosphorylase/glucosamine-1-phosphate N-acetyltransferase
MHSKVAKPLHTVAGKPMIDHVLAAASSIDLHSIIVVLNPTLAANDGLIGHLADDQPNRIEFAVQDQPRGTGDALRAALTSMVEADRVLILFADHPLLTPASVQTMLAEARASSVALLLLTCVLDNAAGYGRIERSEDGAITRIVERTDDTLELRAGPTEVNSGMMVVDSRWVRAAVDRLAASPRTGEYYLTELVELAVSDGLTVASVQGLPQELVGINDRVDLAHAEEIALRRVRELHQRNGVTLELPETIVIEAGVTIGEDSVIRPGSIIRAGSSIGVGCEIGPNSILSGARIGADCRIVSSLITDSTVDDGSDVGPFSHIRGNSVIEAGVHVGNFAEIKSSTLARGVRMGHFGYAGDASIGADSNIGAGAVTCNFDGVAKHPTVIGERVFVGSDTMLVAPVTIGDDAILGAGSVVTRDVAEGDTVFGVPARSRGSQTKAGKEQT